MDIAFPPPFFNCFDTPSLMNITNEFYLVCEDFSQIYCQKLERVLIFFPTLGKYISFMALILKE